MKPSVSVGDIVKLGNLEGTLLPKLMRGSIQHVVDVRVSNLQLEIQIERTHRGRIVRCWISAALVSAKLAPDEAFPPDACLVRSPHRKGSGKEAHHRQACLVCRQKLECRYYQSHHARGSK